MLQLRESPMRSLQPEHSEIKRYHRREHLIMILGFIISWGPFAWIYIPTVLVFLDRQGKRKSKWINRMHEAHYQEPKPIHTLP